MISHINTSNMSYESINIVRINKAMYESIGDIPKMINNWYVKSYDDGSYCLSKSANEFNLSQEFNSLLFILEFIHDNSTYHVVLSCAIADKNSQSDEYVLGEITIDDSKGIFSIIVNTINRLDAPIESFLHNIEYFKSEDILRILLFDTPGWILNSMDKFTRKLSNEFKNVINDMTIKDHNE